MGNFRQAIGGQGEEGSQDRERIVGARPGVTKSLGRRPGPKKPGLGEGSKIARNTCKLLSGVFLQRLGGAKSSQTISTNVAV